jgi:hypothetical protein
MLRPRGLLRHAKHALMHVSPLFSAPNNQRSIDYLFRSVNLLVHDEDFVFKFAFSASRTSTSHPKRGLRHNCPYIGIDDYLIEPVRVICFRSIRLSSLTLRLRASYVHSSLGISGLMYGIDSIMLLFCVV